MSDVYKQHLLRPSQNGGIFLNKNEYHLFLFFYVE